MVPDSLAAFYALLVLVSPGLAYQLIAERTRPPREESAFREASVVAVTSLVFSSLSILLLAAVGRGHASWFVDLPAWLESGNQYATDHMWLVGRSVGLEVLLAVLLASITAILLNMTSTASTSPIAKTSVWYQALKGDKPKDMASWVMAELIDGTRIWGYVHYFTIQDIGNDRDISFRGPKLTIQRPNGQPETEEYYKYFVVNAAQLRILKVGHEPKKRKKRQRSDRSQGDEATVSETGIDSAGRKSLENGMGKSDGAR
jgi:hypothetical protein